MSKRKEETIWKAGVCVVDSADAKKSSNPCSWKNAISTGLGGYILAGRLAFDGDDDRGLSCKALFLLTQYETQFQDTCFAGGTPPPFGEQDHWSIPTNHIIENG
jgi:hypothetical protein